MNDKICFYTPPFPRVKTYFDMVDVSKEYGLKYIEGFNVLDFALPDLETARKIREYADSKGIGFSCFSVYINLVGDDRKEQIEKLKGYAQIADILGSPYLHHTIANDFSNPENVLPYKEELFQRGVEAVREIYDFCVPLGIKAVYEEQGYLFNGIEGYKRFLAAVDREIGVVADFANIYQGGGTLEEFITNFSDRIVHAHIKNINLSDYNDGNGLKTLNGNYMYEAPVEEGMVDIKRGIELLKNSGYKGYYGLEYGVKTDDEQMVRNALRYIDSLL